MTTIDHILSLDLDPLLAGAEELSGAAARIEQVAAQVRTARPPGWQALAAQAAADAGVDGAARLGAQAAAGRAAGAALHDGHAALTAAQALLAARVAALDRDGYVLAPDGAVSLAPEVVAGAIASGIDPGTAEMELAGRAEEVHGLAREFEAVDRELAQQLTDLAAAHWPPEARTDQATPSFDQVPGTGTPPEAARAWWDGLDAGVQADLLATMPARIGALDGLPATVRDQGNTAALSATIRTLPAGSLRDEASALQRMLADDPRTSLLSVTRRGARMTATVGLGEVDGADTVLTYSPGTATTIGSLPEMIDQMSVLTDEAARFSDRSGDHDRSYAAVLAMDYDLPPHISDAAWLGRAKAAAPDLAQLWAGLDVAAEVDDRRLVASGHSYGTYVAALAMLEDPQAHPVDAAVFIGSPGLPAGEAAAFGLPDGAAFHLTADDDPVARAHELKSAGKGATMLAAEAGLSRLGVDVDLPRLPMFSGPLDPAAALLAEVVLPYDHPDDTAIEALAYGAGLGPDGTPADGASGHSEYLRPGPTGMRMSTANLAAVLADRTDWAVRVGD